LISLRRYPTMAGGKSTKKIQLSIEAVAAMLLLVMLAALTMLLISSTGRGYKNIVSEGGTSQDIRTGLFFISTKVRQADSGNINVVKSPFGGNALVISKAESGTVNEDWIFYYGGALREVTIPKGTTINPPACPVISPLSSVSLTQAGNLLTITATKKAPDKNGRQATVSQSLILTLRT
jgi:hypothetical protein